jgi:PleD family two-component response regulator
VLLPETSAEMARVVAERIRAKAAELSDSAAFTVSIDVTINLPDGDTGDALLARADTAMYKAKDKDKGRNQMMLG